MTHWRTPARVVSTHTSRPERSPAGMEIAFHVSVAGRGVGVERAHVDAPLRAGVEQDQRLLPVGAGIGVGHQPASARPVHGVAVGLQRAAPHDRALRRVADRDEMVVLPRQRLLHAATPAPGEPERRAQHRRREPAAAPRRGERAGQAARPHQDRVVVAPAEVADLLLGEDAHVRPVPIHHEEARPDRPIRGEEAVQERDPAAGGAVERMRQEVRRRARRRHRPERRHVRHRQEQPAPAGFEVQLPEPVVGGRRRVGGGRIDARDPVGRPVPGKPPVVRRHALAPGAVDRADRKGEPLPGPVPGVLADRTEAAVLHDVVDEAAVRKPLRPGAHLEVPGGGGAGRLGGGAGTPQADLGHLAPGKGAHLRGDAEDHEGVVGGAPRRHVVEAEEVRPIQGRFGDGRTVRRAHSRPRGRTSGNAGGTGGAASLSLRRSPSPRGSMSQRQMRASAKNARSEGRRSRPLILRK